MVDSDIDDLERETPRPRRLLRRDGKSPLASDNEPEEEIDFETAGDLSSPPEEVLAKYGDSMISDVPDKAVTFKDPEPVKEDSLVPKKQQWMDAFTVDLSRGVPLISLQDDVNKIRGQNFVCISFIFRESYDTLHCGDRIYRGDLIKIRGVFKTRENADRYIKETLLVNDPHTKVYLARCFSWSTFEDDGDDDERTRENQLDEVDQLLRGYYENENERLSSFQRRINIVKSRNKNRAKETAEFFETTQKHLEEERARNMRAREIYEATGRNYDLDEIKRMLESDACDELMASTPVIELREDSEKIEGQNWACLSCIHPKEYKSRSYPNDDYKRPLIKVRGIFSSREEADQHIRNKIQPLDGSIDVMLVPCFRWSGLDDDDVKERAYMGGDERCKLKQLLNEYIENKNDQIFDVPQQRVYEARKMRSEAANGDTSKLPYDARIVPPLNNDGALEDITPASASASAPKTTKTRRLVDFLGDVSEIKEVKEEEEEEEKEVDTKEEEKEDNVTVMGVKVI